MNIRSINQNLNFKGLWQISTGRECGRTPKNKIPVYYHEAIYHPFKDEKKSEIKEAINKEKRHFLYACFDERTNSIMPSHFTVIKHTLGKKLKVKEKNYTGHEIYEEKGHPTSSDSYMFFTPWNPRDPEILPLFQPKNK